MKARRGPRPHGAVHVYDDKGICHLCDMDHRRRQAAYRERQRQKGLRLRRGYWTAPEGSDVAARPGE